MDPDQSARKRGLVWIHAGRKPTMLVLSGTAHMTSLKNEKVIKRAMLTLYDSSEYYGLLILITVILITVVERHAFKIKFKTVTGSAHVVNISYRNYV
jgi:hypothetical protein